MTPNEKFGAMSCTLRPLTADIPDLQGNDNKCMTLLSMSDNTCHLMKMWLWGELPRFLSNKHRHSPGTAECKLFVDFGHHALKLMSL